MESRQMSHDDNRITMQERITRMLDSAQASIDRTYPQAQDDADAVGWREHNGKYSNGRGSSELTSVESAAERLLKNGDFAAKWLNDVSKITRQLFYLASMAERHWPKLRPGDEIDGVTIGERGNAVENCAHCGDPVSAGRLPSGHTAIIRIDGRPFHRNTCYAKMWRENRINESA
jgi:hypothetical protein